MKYKVCVATSTRADYGIMRPLLKKLVEGNFDLSIIACGTHLEKKYGNTIEEIRKDAFGVIHTISTYSGTSTPNNLTTSIIKTVSGVSDIFDEYNEGRSIHALIILGDRYEMLAVAYAAYIYKIPIIHLHGGEITEGAIDDSIRHAITKLSSLHFTSNEEHKNRVIQMGEAPDRVYNVGALGVENVLNIPILSKQELEDNLGINLDKPYMLVTYHPTTQGKVDSLTELNIVLDAIKDCQDINYIFTKSNADMGGREINCALEVFCQDNPNAYLFDSLGVVRYMSAMKYAIAVLGNSSSGIIETPSMKIQTINIGDRQNGRLRAKSVMDVALDTAAIKEAIQRVYKESDLPETYYDNPYGDGLTSGRIYKIIKEKLDNNELVASKRFYDIKL
ncbi:MAG: UDP-N-acetylglucosamine 2-epimerase (hydrolyzing) [Eubacterium sp.]|nr:UDP-N-acetylglucosamine 2-epimerase (hydrolyzing) [Eubacterium sp.]